MRSYGLSLLILAMLLPATSLAQSVPSGDGSSPFTLSSSPDFPPPNSQAVLSFVSSSLDLNAATVRVKVNGKEIYAGAVHSVPVQLGAAGSIANISATISAQGANYTQTISIVPQDVALVVEPLSTAPVLYPGKPLIPLEGSVRIVAMAGLRTASGASVSPAAVSYSWTVDGTQIANSSGIGKSTIIVTSPLQYRTREVSVAVSSGDGSLSGGASVSLSPSDPALRIYENDPLLGIRFERAVSNSYSIQSSEATLFAAPFSLPSASAPRIEWFLNGVSAQRGNSITLRPSGAGQGTASLSVLAQATDLAKATAALSLIFGGKPAVNLFGL